MFNTGNAAAADAEDERESRGGLFLRMRDSLSKSRRAMTQQLAAVMSTRPTPTSGSGWRRP